MVLVVAEAVVKAVIVVMMSMIDRKERVEGTQMVASS